MNFHSIIFNFYLSLCRTLPVKKNKIVFLSHLGKTYGCNPRYLCEYIAKNFPKKYELIWIFDRSCGRPRSLPMGVKAVPYYSHRCLAEMATAGIIISNTRISDGFYWEKRKRQFYIQTWHSSLRLKCIEADANLGDQYIDFAKRDSKKIDLIISGGSFSSTIFKNSFWYNGIILETGTPRIDWLKNQTNESKRVIYEKANLDSDTHYLLYAPTFRGNGSISAYNIEFKKLLKSLTTRFGGIWKILYRLHPNLKGKTKIDNSDSNIIDMTDYDDIQELLVISDILLTDFSSSMFDAALCNIKCILYASDLDQYLQKERELYFDIHKLPFPLAKSTVQLSSIIEQFDENQYKTRIENFLKGTKSCEYGNACEQIEKIIDKRL